MREESKRQKQVSEVIKRNFGIVLQQQGSYIYQDALVTVTSVKTSPDFGLAKIYLSVYNAEDKEVVIENLTRHVHSLRKDLAFRIKKHVRKIPQINLFLDETLDEVFKMNALFDQIKKEQPASQGKSEEE